MSRINNPVRLKTLPLLALRGLVVFPGNLIHFDVGRTPSLNALHRAMDDDQNLFLVTQKDSTVEHPLPEDWYSVGVVAHILQIMKLPDEKFRVVAEGIYRADMKGIIQAEPFFLAETVERIDRNTNNADKAIALERELRTRFEEDEKESPVIPPDVLSKVQKADSLSLLSDTIAHALSITLEGKQALLEMVTVTRRAERVLNYLAHEQKILDIELDLQRKVQENIDDNQKDYFLREQLRVINDELGEDDNPQEEAEEYRIGIKSLHLEEDIEKKLLKECSKLSKMPVGSHEATVVRTYLDTVLALPWNQKTEEVYNLKNARKILDDEHYGLEEVKERIMEILAVRQLSKEIKGQVVCLVGPPGVGKTSIASSIAKAMGRKYARVSLGGVRDEADIRGHRKTYIGAMMGRIMDAVNQAGSCNPFILLDEIDKLGNDYRGDPASALLEVLDTEQNVRFVDHFLDIPFDLSKVVFMTTANLAETIPAPLYDRMDVITLSGYTEREKIQIAKNHLIKKQIKANGLTAKQFMLSETVLKAIIEGYTREAGVRTLERTIAKLCRKVALEKVENNKDLKITVKNLEKLLGPRKYMNEDPSLVDAIGVVNGLAWTSTGGELLPIEVSILEGTGKVELTGSLGDVMKESAKIAISIIRDMADKLGIQKDFYKTKDIHIHAPEGAVPKEGPSAGITMTVALASALMGKPVKGSVAMTGEVSLRGKVLPIGGLKEKTMAAYMNDMERVFIPKENVPDIQKIDKEVLDKVQLIPVKTVEEVLEMVLVGWEKGKNKKHAYLASEGYKPSTISSSAEN